MQQHTAWYLGIRNEKRAFEMPEWLGGGEVEVPEILEGEDRSVGRAALTGAREGALGGALTWASIPLILQLLAGPGRHLPKSRVLPAMGVFGAGGGLLGAPLGAVSGATSQATSNLFQGRNVLSGE